MTALAAALVPCPLPGCKSATDQVGKPCSDCLAAFGEAIHEIPGSTLDPEAFLRAQREGETRIAVIHAERTLAMAEVSRETARRKVREIKPNQHCWLCEQRRTCVRTPQGWECRTCEETVR